MHAYAHAANKLAKQRNMMRTIPTKLHIALICWNESGETSGMKFA